MEEKIKDLEAKVADLKVSEDYNQWFEDNISVFLLKTSRIF